MQAMPVPQPIREDFELDLSDGNKAQPAKVEELFWENFSESFEVFLAGFDYEWIENGGKDVYKIEDEKSSDEVRLVISKFERDDIEFIQEIEIVLHAIIREKAGFKDAKSTVEEMEFMSNCFIEPTHSEGEYKFMASVIDRDTIESHYDHEIVLKPIVIEHHPFSNEINSKSTSANSSSLDLSEFAAVC